VTKRLVVSLVAAFAAQSAFAFPLTGRAELDLDLDIPRFAAGPELSGMISMGCSGAVIRFRDDPSDQALVLTNGHCVGFPDPGRIFEDRPYDRALSIHARDGSRHRFRTTRIVYATMTGTDVGIVAINATYGQLAALGIDSYQIAPDGAVVGEEVKLISGYFSTVTACDVEGVVYELREAGWVMHGSYKYRCNAIPGTSGSPLIASASGLIAGVNNTGNEDGRRCTMNNPCEVDEEGNIVVVQGMNYGQRTDLILTCVDEAGRFDLDLPGCGLLH
jgi:hypothetical protein